MTLENSLAKREQQLGIKKSFFALGLIINQLIIEDIHVALFEGRKCIKGGYSPNILLVLYYYFLDQV